MVAYLKPILLKNEELAVEERNVVCAAYKTLCATKRNAWRAVSSIEENSKYEKFRSDVKVYKAKIETDLKNICRDVLSIVDGVLFKNASSAESKAFYMKMKADYYRYLGEVCADAELEEVTKKAQESYEEAWKMAEGLSPTHPIRLGLALNFSVFQYELRKNTKEACKIAKLAYNEGLQGGEQEKGKEAGEIMLLIKENLTQWSEEINKPET